MSGGVEGVDTVEMCGGGWQWLLGNDSGDGEILRDAKGKG